MITAHTDILLIKFYSDLMKTLEITGFIPCAVIKQSFQCEVYIRVSIGHFTIKFGYFKGKKREWMLGNIVDIIIGDAYIAVTFATTERSSIRLRSFFFFTHDPTYCGSIPSICIHKMFHNNKIIHKSNVINSWRKWPDESSLSYGCLSPIRSHVIV